MTISEPKVPAGPTHVGPRLLRKLNVVDGIAMGAAGTAATQTIGMGIGALTLAVGWHMPALLFLAFIPMLGIATAYARLNRVEPNCGNAYAWIGRSLGPWLGFLVGWMAVVSAVIFTAAAVTYAGSAILTVLITVGVNSVGGIVVDPNSTLMATLVGFIVLTVTVATAIVGTKLATGIQRYLLTFEYTVLIAFLGYGLFAGSQPYSWSWFNPLEIPSFSAVAQGVVVAVIFFWGFEAVFGVTEETKDPADASRAGRATLFIVFALFLLAAVSFQRVFDPNATGDDAGAVGLTNFGDKLVGSPLSILIVFALMSSLWGSLQSTIIYYARYMFAMGRDKTLGPVWTKISPRFHTPAIGTALYGLLAAVCAIASVAVPKVSDVLTSAVTSVGMIVTFWYGLVALAAVVRFRSMLWEKPVESLRAVVYPFVSALILLSSCAYLAWNFYQSADHYSFDPENGWFILTIPLAIISTGVVAALYAKFVRKSPYFVTGSGTDADDDDLLVEPLISVTPGQTQTHASPTTTPSTNQGGTHD